MFYDFLFGLALVLFPVSLLAAAASTWLRIQYDQPSNIQRVLDNLKGNYRTFPHEGRGYLVALVTFVYMIVYLIH